MAQALCVGLSVRSLTLLKLIDVNTGAGTFCRLSGALPSEETSGSCAAAADYDKDGDLDLFVGGRLAAQNYPLYPKSFLLRNDTRNGNVKFTDITMAEAGQGLQLAGMVTDALWSDNQQRLLARSPLNR